MGRKKKDSIIEENKPKSASIIDYINWLTIDKKKWIDLSKQDQKNFQPYIVNRWLSMDLLYCEAINELQQYTMGMDKSLVWKMYYEFLPKEKVYIKYIKTKNLENISDEEVECFKKYFLISERECIEYLQLLKSIPNGEEEINKIKYNFKQ